MGNLQPTIEKKKQLTPEQEDIQYLADRMAFGDEELIRLYRTYHAIEKSSNRISFLSDWGVYSKIYKQTRKPSQLQPSQEVQQQQQNEQQKQQQIQEERLLLMQILETKILPVGFGNRLYETSFSKNGQSYTQQQPQQQPQGGQQANNHDKYTQLAKLESFFDGLSNCGRRGSNATISVIVDCCEQIQTPQSSSSSSSSPSPSQPEFLDSSSGNTTNNNNQRDRWIRSEDFVNLGYRIALSCAFLEAAARDDDVSVFIPPTNDNDDNNKGTTKTTVLTSLADSIFNFAKERRIRLGLPPPPATRSKEGQQQQQQQQQQQEERLVTKNDVLEWAGDIAPMFASTLSTFMYRIFFPDQKFPPSRTPFDYPRIPNESAFFHTDNSPLLFTFGCLSSGLGGTFFRLYTSLSDGLSFNRLLNALYGYNGPTLLIIREADNGGIFGAYTSSQWKENKDFYGTSDCFLFQLLPTFAVYRPSGNATNYMYCNSEARSRGYDGQAHGIGFGGTTLQPRLFINESFDNNVASSRDMTYQNGPLLPSLSSPGNSTTTSNAKHFDIESLEVWGVGGDDVVQQALGDRNMARSIKDATIKKAKKVDKAAFLDDFRAGIIDSKQFDYLKQIQGRAECDIEEMRQEREHQSR